MPRLREFAARAVSCELQIPRPLDRAAIWTSLLTGVRATKHGVVHSREFNANGTRIGPASRRSLAAAPLGSILGAAGRRTHALGWPASHPAEEAMGVVVSDQFAECGAEGSVYPAEHLKELGQLRLEPAGIDAASLVTLLPRAAELNPIADQRLFLIARFLALTASLHGPATWLLEHEPWEFAAVRYSGLARLESVFGAALAASRAGEAEHEAELFGCVVPNAYRFFDMCLGRLLDLAGADTTVMLALQPPLQAERDSGSRAVAPPMALLASGPGVRSHRELASAHVCDLAPTVLRLFGIAPDLDFDGKPIEGLLAPGGDVRPLEKRPGASIGGGPAAGGGKRVADDEHVAHLEALGYCERPDEYLALAIDELECDRRWNLAEGWLDTGRWDRAVETLESLVALAPGSLRYRSVLAEGYFYVGQLEASRRLILQLMAEGVETALGRAGLAAVDARNGDVGSAAGHLRQAEVLRTARGREWELIGRLYLSIRRRGDAARALDAALALEPQLATAHEARAQVCLTLNDSKGAERHARQAIEIDASQFDAWHRLGLALARQERTDEAIAALREAAALRPGAAGEAHRSLAEIFERRGEPALAMHHRATADRSRERRSWPRSAWESLSGEGGQ